MSLQIIWIFWMLVFCFLFCVFVRYGMAISTPERIHSTWKKQMMDTGAEFSYVCPTYLWEG